MLDLIFIIWVSGGILLLLLLVAWSFWKIRRLHLAAFVLNEKCDRLLRLVSTESQNLFSQIQAQRQLEKLLEIDRPLPLTRGWAASPDILLALVKQVFERRPGTLLDCGSGISTLILALACKRQGRGIVISLDHLEEFAARTDQLLTEWGVREFVDLRVAPLQSREIEGRSVAWYSVEALPDSLDFIFVDGPPELTGPFARWPAGPLLLPSLAPGGAVVIDDANREQDREIIRDWLRRFPNLRSQDLYCEKGGVLLTNIERRLT